MYTELEVSKMKDGKAVKTPQTVQLNGQYAIPVEGDGNGILFVVDNENLCHPTITVMAADNVFCGGDHILTFKDNCKSVIHFEGAPYVQRSGEHKGKILIRGGDEAEFAFVSVMEIL